MLRRLIRLVGGSKGKRQSKISENEVDRVSEAIDKLRLLHRADLAYARSAVYDGVSGPCLGCASTVYTGYTGGVMGIPSDPDDWWGGSTLGNVIVDLCLAMGYSDLNQCLRDAASGEAALPKLEAVAERVCSGGKGSIKVDEKFKEGIKRAIEDMYGDKGIRDHAAEALAEALAAYMLLDLDSTRPLPCPLALVGSVIKAKDSDDKVYTLIFNVEKVLRNGA